MGGNWGIRICANESEIRGHKCTTATAGQKHRRFLFGDGWDVSGTNPSTLRVFAKYAKLGVFQPSCLCLSRDRKIPINIRVQDFRVGCSWSHGVPHVGP